MIKFFASLSDKFFPSRKVLMEAGSLLSVLSSRGSHGSVPKEDLREYLSKHFSKSEFQKVDDFPTGKFVESLPEYCVGLAFIEFFVLCRFGVD